MGTTMVLEQDEFVLELSKLHTYDDVVERVAKKLGLDNELQGLKTIKVAFHHAPGADPPYTWVVQVVIHNIRLPKHSTVGDVINELKTKVELSHPDAELRLLEVFYHKIYKIFPSTERVENINDQYWTLRAEEVLMATNRIDILDQALLRPGSIDRKIESPNPNGESRFDILKIHSRKMNLMRGIELKKMAEKMNGALGAELKAVCTEAGMFALRERRVHVTQEDFEMAVAKVIEGRHREEHVSA